MKEIDAIIREAMNTEEDRRWFDELDEQSLREMVLDSFKGKSRWLVYTVYFSLTVFTVLFVLSAIRFFAVESEREMITWGLSAIFFSIAIAMLKIWYWIELNKNAVTREIKRFELQLARLTSRFGEE